jgi:hypothetical protein
MMIEEEPKAEKQRLPRPLYLVYNPQQRRIDQQFS